MAVIVPVNEVEALESWKKFLCGAEPLLNRPLVLGKLYEPLVQWT